MAAKATPKNGGSRQRPQYYLVQFSYTAAAWKELLKSPGKRDRIKIVRPLVKALGGCFADIRFECDDAPAIREKFGSFGDHDVVALVCFPNDVAAAAFAMAVSAGEGVTSFKTTRILPWNEVMQAMDMAAQHSTHYAPPGKARG